MSIVASNQHTKEWRTEQTWYQDGKQNECENFQRQCVETITGLPWTQPKGLRLNMLSFDLCHKQCPLKDDGGYEWTEDFDGLLLHHSKTFYINLKFICNQGGAQTRSLREVYHFIATQLRYLAININDENVYFVNILDGDMSFKNMSKFTYLLNCYPIVKERVFVGDMIQFKTFWHLLVSTHKETETKMDDPTKKQIWGQFFTTNYQKILKNLEIPHDITHIIEPFAGAADLLQFIHDRPSITIECYDIDPKKEGIVKRDIFQEPPCYDEKFVLTNPPYLARNKSKDKKYFDKYQVDDLYKCFLKQLLCSNPLGGILIIPVNFWCSVRKSDMGLRRDFLTKYSVLHLNIFEEQVFTDTTYSVCAFQFERRCQENLPIHVSIYPLPQHFSVHLSKTNHFLIGGDIYNLKRTHTYTITRLTKHNKDKPYTTILLKCIDDEQPIGMSIVSKENVYIDETPNTSARSYATLVIDPPISLEQQQLVVDGFNVLLHKYRTDFHSLFLSNYRENQRKRISFDLAYHIVGHLLEKS